MVGSCAARSIEARVAWLTPAARARRRRLRPASSRAVRTSSATRSRRRRARADPRLAMAVRGCRGRMRTIVTVVVSMSLVRGFARSSRRPDAALPRRWARRSLASKVRAGPGAESTGRSIGRWRHLDQFQRRARAGTESIGRSIDQWPGGDGSRQYAPGPIRCRSVDRSADGGQRRSVPPRARFGTVCDRSIDRPVARRRRSRSTRRARYGVDRSIDRPVAGRPGSRSTRRGLHVRTRPDTESPGRFIDQWRHVETVPTTSPGPERSRPVDRSTITGVGPGSRRTGRAAIPNGTISPARHDQPRDCDPPRDATAQGASPPATVRSLLTARRTVVFESRATCSRPHQTHPDHRRHGAGPTGPVDTVAPERVQSAPHLPQRSLLDRWARRTGSASSPLSRSARTAAACL